MKRTYVWTLIWLLIALVLIVTACTPTVITVTQPPPVTQTVTATPTSAATQAPTTTQTPTTTQIPPSTTSSTQTATQTPTTTIKTIIEDAIVVSFDQNPVPVKDGYFNWKVILTETKGIGVTLKTLTVQHYSATGPASSPKTYNTLDWFNSWLPNAYLAANGKASFNAGTNAQPLAYDTYVITGVNDKGQEIIAKGKVDFAQVIEDAIVISFDPNPVTLVGHVYWKVILTNTKGFGITLKTLTVQYYSASGPAGSPNVYNTKEWFQGWLPNAYLPANGKASFTAGTDSGPIVYCMYIFAGENDSGQGIYAKGKVDFKQ